MTTLETQIRQLAEIADEAMPWIAPDEIQSPVADSVVPPLSDEPGRPVRRVVVVALTFAAALILVGGVALLTPFSGASEPTDEPTTTTEPPNTTVSVPPELAETLRLLDDTLADAPVYHALFGTEITTQLRFLQGYLQDVARSSFSPQPVFDTSSLGVELTLIELRPSTLSSLPGADAYPFVAGAQLEGTGHVVISEIGISFKNGKAETQCGLSHAVIYKGILSPGGGGAAGGGCGPHNHDWGETNTPNIVSMGGGWSSLSPIVIAGLPPEASVVATTLADGTRVWQRPHLGMAIFVEPDPECTPSDGSPLCDIEVTVLNAEGVEILRIKSADGDVHPIGFTVTWP